MHTVSQAAKLLDVSPQRIHYLIKINRLKATRYGAIWMVDNLRIKAGKNGRPRKNA